MSPTDEELKRRGVFGPSSKVAEHITGYKAMGVDRFVTRFPIDNQRD